MLFCYKSEVCLCYWFFKQRQNGNHSGMSFFLSWKNLAKVKRETKYNNMFLLWNEEKGKTFHKRGNNLY